jgi:hypothetical protein
MSPGCGSLAINHWELTGGNCTLSLRPGIAHTNTHSFFRLQCSRKEVTKMTAKPPQIVP